MDFKAQKGFRFLVSTPISSDIHVSIFSFLFFSFFFFFGGGGGYEMMSNFSQNCWIDWNSAKLCFKQLFHIVV